MLDFWHSAPLPRPVVTHFDRQALFKLSRHLDNMAFRVFGFPIITREYRLKSLCLLYISQYGSLFIFIKSCYA
jgi:hypothetical protein